MERGALEFLQEQLGTTTVLPIDGREYTNRKVHAVMAPTAPTLEVVSLDAMVQYLKGNLDKLAEPLMAQVKSPTLVELYGATFGDFRQRDMFMVADCGQVLPDVVFGSFLPQEAFVIMLASGFVNADALGMVRVGGKPVLVRKPVRREGSDGKVNYDDPEDAADAEQAQLSADLGDLEYCAEVATSLVDKAEAVHQDDGLAQTVTLKAGSGSLVRTELKETVKLRPYRTFVDVMQPMSMFKLRVRPGGGLALFEADGGRWRLEAMANVQAELEFRLAEAKVENVTVIA
ncbi:MAG: hypothetical protein K9K66_04330 [Desulfarculaceae bacterium]|nr:hypothetical protein [Desulfarculaceae bacterium]MCF8073270.1 hypothetical protein [Desulfarculaceae bacterium]MCF8100866.1 hypothetical protein [Desulfarculaceae bacterium]